MEAAVSAAGRAQRARLREIGVALADLNDVVERRFGIPISLAIVYMAVAERAHRGTWVNRAPAFAQPYLRLSRYDRPVGFWLLGLPAGIGMATLRSMPCSPANR